MGQVVSGAKAKKCSILWDAAPSGLFHVIQLKKKKRHLRLQYPYGLYLEI
jgi:hypothetical protein